MTLPATGPWELPVRGWEILSVFFAFQIYVIAYGDEGRTTRIVLAGGFELTEPDGVVRKLDAEEQSCTELAVVLTLRHALLNTLSVSETAELVVTLAGGRTLRAGPDRRYENWEVHGPASRLIAMPGDGSDGVAVFS